MYFICLHREKFKNYLSDILAVLQPWWKLEYSQNVGQIVFKYLILTRVTEFILNIKL